MRLSSQYPHFPTKLAILSFSLKSPEPKYLACSIAAQPKEYTCQPLWLLRSCG